MSCITKTTNLRVRQRLKRSTQGQEVVCFYSGEDDGTIIPIPTRGTNEHIERPPTPVADVTMTTPSTGEVSRVNDHDDTVTIYIVSGVGGTVLLAIIIFLVALSVTRRKVKRKRYKESQTRIIRQESGIYDEIGASMKDPTYGAASVTDVPLSKRSRKRGISASPYNDSVSLPRRILRWISFEGNTISENEAYPSSEFADAPPLPPLRECPAESNEVDEEHDFTYVDGQAGNHSSRVDVYNVLTMDRQISEYESIRRSRCVAAAEDKEIDLDYHYFVLENPNQTDSRCVAAEEDKEIDLDYHYFVLENPNQTDNNSKDVTYTAVNKARPCDSEMQDKPSSSSEVNSTDNASYSESQSRQQSDKVPDITSDDKGVRSCLPEKETIVLDTELKDITSGDDIHDSISDHRESHSHCKSYLIHDKVDTEKVPVRQSSTVREGTKVPEDESIDHRDQFLNNIDHPYFVLEKEDSIKIKHTPKWTSTDYQIPSKPSSDIVTSVDAGGDDDIPTEPAPDPPPSPTLSMDLDGSDYLKPPTGPRRSYVDVVPSCADDDCIPDNGYETIPSSEVGPRAPMFRIIDSDVNKYAAKQSNGTPEYLELTSTCDKPLQ